MEKLSPQNTQRLWLGRFLRVLRALLLLPIGYLILIDEVMPSFWLLIAVACLTFVISFQVKPYEVEKPYYTLWTRFFEMGFSFYIAVALFYNQWWSLENTEIPKLLLTGTILLGSRMLIYPFYAISLIRESKDLRYSSVWARLSRMSILITLALYTLNLEHFSEISMGISILMMLATSLAFTYRYYRDPDHRKPLSIASQITTSRIVLTPVFILVFFYDNDLIYHNNHPVFKWLALLMVMTFMATDWLDGYLARKMGDVSTLGKYLDPFSDKISNMTIFLCFMASGYANIWMVALIYFREASVETLRTLAASQGITVDARQSGKYKTAIQGGGILWILAGALNLTHEIIPGFSSIWSYFPQVVMGIVTFVTLASGIDYFVANQKVLKRYL